ncbi:hypothetical protein [Clostridium sp.]|uniref:hypothetical protein n=1 Tax=Clostridium sp. TaxID=1506 RepID=UPI00263622BB|nr:hypothetical protein [Clostridium sp.]
MAQIKATLSQDQINNILKQVQDLIAKIEETPPEIKPNLDTSTITKEIEDIKNQINGVSESVKPIEFTVDTQTTKEQFDSVKGDFSQVIEELNKIGTITDITTKFKNGNLDSFIVQLQEVEGLMDKISLKTTGYTEGKNYEQIPTNDFNISSITEYDNRVKIANQALQESLTLLKQYYDLEEDIITAKQKEKDATVEVLSAQQEEIQSLLNSSLGNLNDSSIDTFSEKVKTLQNNLKLTWANIADSEAKSLQQAQDSLDNFVDKTNNTLNRLGNRTITAKFDTSTITDGITKIQEELNSLNANEFNSNITAKITNSVRELETQFGELKAQANSVGGAFTDMVGNIGKFASWMASATIMMQSINLLKQMATDVTSLDSQLTQLSYTSNQSTEELKNFTESQIQAAAAIGGTAQQATEAAKIFTYYGASQQDIAKNTQAAIALSNISGQDIQTVASQLQAATNQFDAMSGKTADVANSYASVASHMSMDFQTSVQNISEAVKTAGSAMNEAGMS